MVFSLRCRCVRYGFCSYFIFGQLTHLDAFCVCIFHYFIHLIAVSLSFFVFLSLCVAFVVHALVFLPRLYSAAYRAALHAEPAEGRISLCAYLLFVSYVCAFVCVVCVSCGCIFILSLLCPVLATMSFANYFIFLSVLFCLLSCPAFLFFSFLFFSKLFPV